MVTVGRKYQIIDMQTGQLDRRIFVDPDIYAEEQEKVFGRAWLMIGHESLVSRPNDYFHTYMGEEPVILCRDGKGNLRAYLNMCPPPGQPHRPHRPGQRPQLRLRLSRLDLLQRG